MGIHICEFVVALRHLSYWMRGWNLNIIIFEKRAFIQTM
jgi:hypothetical protein